MEHLTKEQFRKKFEAAEQILFVKHHTLCN